MKCNSDSKKHKTNLIMINMKINKEDICIFIVHLQLKNTAQYVVLSAPSRSKLCK